MIDYLIMNHSQSLPVSLSLQKPVMTQGSWGGGWALCDWRLFILTTFVITVINCKLAGIKDIPIWISDADIWNGSASIYIFKCFLVILSCYYAGLDPHHIYSITFLHLHLRVSLWCAYFTGSSIHCDEQKHSYLPW